MTTLTFFNRSVHINQIRQGMVVQMTTFTGEGKKVPEHNVYDFIQGFGENCFHELTVCTSAGREVHPSNLVLHAVL